MIQAQTRVSGKLLDQKKEPVVFADIYFSGSSVGTTSNEAGEFVLESENNFSEVTVSYVGYETLLIPLTKKETLNLTTNKKRFSKKENPAYRILKKIWEN